MSTGRVIASFGTCLSRHRRITLGHSRYSTSHYARYHLHEDHFRGRKLTCVSFVSFFLCRIAAAACELSPHEPVILVCKSTAFSLHQCRLGHCSRSYAHLCSQFKCTRLRPYYRFCPVRNAFNTRVVGGLKLLPFGPIAKRDCSIDKDCEPHATGMDALASQYKLNMIFTESILVSSSGSSSLCRAHLDTVVCDLCLQAIGFPHSLRPRLVRHKLFPLRLHIQYIGDMLKRDESFCSSQRPDAARRF